MEELLKQELIAYGCELLDSGLIVGTWGNLSARIPGTESMVITPSGKGYRTLSVDDIPIVDFSGQIIEGRWNPSSETAMHLAIYRARADVQAVIHTHSIYATACAVARQPIPPIVEDLVALAGGTVAVADYALAGSAALARNAAAALGQNNAVLLANHGAVGCGSNLHEAKIACMLIEKTAQILICANQLPGGAQILADQDVEVMHAFYLKQYRQR